MEINKHLFKNINKINKNKFLQNYFFYKTNICQVSSHTLTEFFKKWIL